MTAYNNKIERNHYINNNVSKPVYFVDNLFNETTIYVQY